MNKTAILIGASAVAIAAAFLIFRPAPDTSSTTPSPSQDAAMVEVVVPPLEGNAAIGARIFAEACAECHGVNAAGVEGAGPPLIHRIYEPGHHADEAFQRAVAMGVRSHHWRFGDMPPREGLTRADVAMVVSYIRALQKANGIF